MSRLASKVLQLLLPAVLIILPSRSFAQVISHKAMKNIRIFIEFESGTGYSGQVAAQEDFRRAARMGMRILQSAFPSMNATWVLNPGDANVTFVVGNYNNRNTAISGQCSTPENPSGRGGGPANPNGWIGCSRYPDANGEINGIRVYFNTTSSTGTPFVHDNYNNTSRQSLYNSYIPATYETEEYGNPNIANGMGWIDGRFTALQGGEDASHIIVHEFGHSLGLVHDPIDKLPFYGIPWRDRDGERPGDRNSPQIVTPTPGAFPLLPSMYYGCGETDAPCNSDLKPLAIRKHQMGDYTGTIPGLPSPMLHRFNYRVFGRDLYNYLPDPLKAKAEYPAVPGTIRLLRGGSVRLANNWDKAVSAAQLDAQSQSNPYLMSNLYPHSQNPRFAVGTNHVLGIRNDGSLWAWGRNHASQLGDNLTASRSRPNRIGSDNDWVAVAAGDGFSLGLRSDESLWAWGDRAYGQVGDGVFDANNPVRTPKKIGDGWVAITAGSLHALALKNDGSLWGWGYNGYGQLGNGSSVNSAVPVPVANGGSEWVAVSTGTLHTLAMRANGSLWSWGWNDYGTLGNGTTTTSFTPAEVSPGKLDWAMIEASHEHSIATDHFGRALTWGRNQVGQIGGTLGFGALVPTQRVTFDPAATGYMKVAAGQAHSAAIRKDGSLWSWGWNSNGQLGGNQTIGGSFSTPVREATASTKWKDVFAGNFFTVARDDDNMIWTWGDNSYGQLGNGTITGTPQNSPGVAVWCQENPTIGDFFASQETPATPAVTLTVTSATGCGKRVEFYRNGTRISGCDKTSPPYECRISNVPVGSYTYYAQVVDIMNLTAQSPTTALNVHYLKFIGLQTVTTNVSLSTEGTVNWKHFPDMNRKAGAADNLKLLTTNYWTAANSPISFSWSAGTPVASRNNDTWTAFFQYPPGNPNTFDVEFPATGSSTRRARIYFAGTKLTARLMPGVENVSLQATDWIAPSSYTASKYFEVEYRTAASKTLKIQIQGYNAADGGILGMQAMVLR
jgi:hypothetical protein